MLLVWSGVLAYFLTVRGYGRNFFERLLHYRSAVEQGDVSANFIPRDYRVAMNAASPPFGRRAFAVGDGNTHGYGAVERKEKEETESQSTELTLREQLEVQAHEAGILLSDDGLTYIARMGASASETLGELIERAREEYPREDGWIHLNVERLRSLMGDANPATEDFDKTYTPVRSVAEEIPANLPTDADNVVVNASSPVTASLPRDHARVVPASSVPAAMFVGWIASGDMSQAFDHLRTLRAEGHSATDFLSEVLFELDDAYRAQIDGGQSVHVATREHTKRLSKSDIEYVIESLLSGIDRSYSKEQVGIKMGLLRALSYAKRKNH